MAETKYPDLSIRDDWNDRQPPPVTSFGDDVERAGNTPQLGLFHDPETGPFVETSLGAVPADSDTAKAAADVTVRPSEQDEAAAKTTEPGDSGATEPAATKSVKRVANEKNTDA